MPNQLYTQHLHIRSYSMVTARQNKPQHAQTGCDAFPLLSRSFLQETLCWHRRFEIEWILYQSIHVVHRTLIFPARSGISSLGSNPSSQTVTVSGPRKAGELAGWVPTEEDLWQLPSRQVLMSAAAAKTMVPAILATIWYRNQSALPRCLAKQSHTSLHFIIVFKVYSLGKARCR